MAETRVVRKNNELRLRKKDTRVGMTRSKSFGTQKVKDKVTKKRENLESFFMDRNMFMMEKEETLQLGEKGKNPINVKKYKRRFTAERGICFNLRQAILFGSVAAKI